MRSADPTFEKEKNSYNSRRAGDEKKLYEM